MLIAASVGQFHSKNNIKKAFREPDIENFKYTQSRRVNLDQES